MSDLSLLIHWILMAMCTLLLACQPAGWSAGLKD